MDLQLSESERDLVLELLRRALGDLRAEIYKTDTTDYKMQLRERETLLTGVINRLAGVPADPLPE
jgi:hypothetical protein